MMNKQELKQEKNEVEEQIKKEIRIAEIINRARKENENRI